jgi:hypothetical protein
VADYIGPTMRARLTAEGISYADATGWVRIVSDSPLILLVGQGATKAPGDRTTSAVTRLNGVAAGRTIRALASTDLPIGVRRLAAVADVSPGSVSKLLPTLVAEAVVERGGAGEVVDVRRRDLIRRWVRDYSFATSNRETASFIAPRGLTRTPDRLAAAGAVTLTGSAAARRLLPASVTSVVPMTQLALYTADPVALARGLGLIEADRASANVVVAVPQDMGILPADGIAVAPAALVVADLLTLPGRSDAEAEQLMDFFALTDPDWRDSDDARP